MIAVTASAGRRFRVGDLLKFKEGSWWLKRTSGFRNNGKPYNPDSLVLVIGFHTPSNTGFFYGRVYPGGEERLWTSEEFELVSKVDR